MRMHGTTADTLLWLFTWPYFWTLKHFTILPIRRIVSARLDRGKLQRETTSFIHGKLNETKLVTLASTLSAAATIGSFSWHAVQDAPWTVFSAWYLSLILAILSLITAGQHAALIHTLPPPSNEDPAARIRAHAVLRFVAVIAEPQQKGAPKSPSTKKAEDATASIKMMYIWQNPIMLMAWSVVTFIVGLTLVVTSPLRRDKPGINDRKTAIFVLVSGGVALLNFGWSSFWFYQAARYNENLEAQQESGCVEIVEDGEVGA
ncbi:hypothetical protein DE146DRAFT_772181 [Phaeosphaeria sp. MPI-PUGE-AT-0046c]|nr:hypothetical protein DE146DRAFT_772181 [Phaeosphaeria sp. MPI-PUGE-AT-0046c]